MGADLIVAVAVQEHPERTLSDLRSKVSQLDEPTALSIYENVQGLGWEEMQDMIGAEEESCLPYVQEWLTDFISLAWSKWYHRGVTFMQHPQLDKLIAIGGGDSYGDTPEGYNIVAAAAEWGEW